MSVFFFPFVFLKVKRHYLRRASRGAEAEVARGHGGRPCDEPAAEREAAAAARRIGHRGCVGLRFRGISAVSAPVQLMHVYFEYMLLI